MSTSETSICHPALLFCHPALDAGSRKKSLEPMDSRFRGNDEKLLFSVQTEFLVMPL